MTESHPSESRPSRPARRAGRIDSGRIDDVFGDVLPETTSDERGRESAGGRPDSWYLENRPPHHDH